MFVGDFCSLCYCIRNSPESDLKRVLGLRFFLIHFILKFESCSFWMNPVKFLDRCFQFVVKIATATMMYFFIDGSILWYGALWQFLP